MTDGYDSVNTSYTRHLQTGDIVNFVLWIFNSNYKYKQKTGFIRDNRTGFTFYLIIEIMTLSCIVRRRAGAPVHTHAPPGGSGALAVKCQWWAVKKRHDVCLTQPQTHDEPTRLPGVGHCR